MHYESTNKSQKIAIIVPIILAILSPHWFVEADKPQENKTAVYQTGSEAPKANSSSWTIQETKKDWKDCNAECKVETLIKLGIKSQLANAIVNECKQSSIDPRKCIIIASSIAKNESGWGSSNACRTRYNCMGVASGSREYTSIEEWIAQWVSIYSRKWYKAKDASFFYPDKWEYSPSRYCVSEQSSNSTIGCPFWQKHMQNTWNKLEKIF